jgi:DNA-binding transcriptional LysR family regulator
MLATAGTLRKALLFEHAIASYDDDMVADPKSLRLFLRVVELGTIAAAAARENIAAAALSKRISDLEEDLGATLLQRTNKGIEATAAGLQLVQRARPVLNDLEAISREIQEFARGGGGGQVRLFATLSALTQYLPNALGSFSREYPRATVHLEEHVTLDIARAVAENAADVGILVGEPPVADLSFHRYREDDLAAVVPLGHPLEGTSTLTASQLFEYDLVGLNPRSLINQQLIRAAQDLGGVCRFRVQVASYDVLCHMVEAGLGLGVLPLRLARAYRKAMRLGVLSLNEPWAHRTLNICVRQNSDLPSATAALLDHLLRTPADQATRRSG